MDRSEFADIAGSRPEEVGLPPLKRLQVKFKGVVLPPTTYTDSVALAVVQFLQIETSSPVRYLTGVRQTERRDEGVYICAPTFWEKKGAEVRRVKAELGSTPLQALPELLNVVVVIVDTGGNVTGTMRPPSRHQHPRYYQVYLLQSPTGFSLLLTHKHYAFLSNIESFGSSFVLESITKAWKDSPVQEAVDRAGDLLVGHVEHSLAFALSLLELFGQWLEQIPAFRWCKSEEIADSMNALYTPFLQVLESPFIISRACRELFIQVSQILSKMTLPRALIAKCYRCEKASASVTLPRCGHRYCDSCIKSVTPGSSGPYFAQCTCGQPQPEELLLQNSDWLATLKARGEALHCEVCKLVKASVLFGRKCCKLRTCVSCLRDSDVCSFCNVRVDVDTWRMAVTCQHCRSTSTVASTYSSLCAGRHLLCSTCQAFSLAYGCVVCKAPYPKDASFILQSRVQVQCIKCNQQKPWRAFFFQKECLHPFCKDCRVRYGWKCNLCGIECTQETQLAGNSIIWESFCIQCHQAAEDTKTQRRNRLHCGCFLHNACRETYYIGRLAAGQKVITCPRLVEIDHSALQPYFRSVGLDYLQSRQLQFSVICSCGHNELVTQGFHDPREWLCPKCRKSVCVLCREPWDRNGDHPWQCIFACAYRKKLRLEQRHANTAIVQCPKCAEPAAVSSQTTVSCEMCGTEYCAKCSVPIDLITRHGAFYHRDLCPFYPKSAFPMESRCGRCPNTRPCPKPSDLLIQGQFTPSEFHTQQVRDA